MPCTWSLDDLVLEVMDLSAARCGNSCVDTRDGFFERIKLTYDDSAPDDVAYHELIFETVEHEVIGKTPLFGERTLATLGCMTSPPPLGSEGEYCARLIAYDLAGNSAGDDVVRCAAVQKCAFSIDDAAAKAVSVVIRSLAMR